MYQTLQGRKTLNACRLTAATRAALLVLFACALGHSHAFAQRKAPARQAQPQHAHAKAAAADKKPLYYSCPMHPTTVKSPRAGKCPKCGMDLRPVFEETAVTTTTTTAAAPVAAGLKETGRSYRVGNTKTSIPDVELVNQDGQKINFYRDLVKDKVVAINFIFTTCTTICPPLGATFARVQRELGERVGKDVSFISISVDPVTDTPERLKAWGAKFRAGAGWTFVTGDKQQIDQLLNAFAATVARREDHSPTVIVVNDAKGVVTRTYGLAKPLQLIQVINDAIAGTNAESSMKEQE
ncbi:MAG TPA: SCO family protein [Pyrinomonadaceae bacterium]|jgi:cytochrome oxidase Cu insertion factor (SCO1/SenC/PrrC family)|nr:SCO family protein [Pyrinomonadaceae bacterium]